MHEEYNKILKYNNGEKSMRVPLIIIADLEFFLEKMNHCLNIAHLIQQKEKLDNYRGKNCMKNTCSAKIINYEKKEIIPLTKKEEKKYNQQEVYHIC